MPRMSPKSQSQAKESLISKHEAAEEQYQNASAKIRGRRAYYQGSPSSKEVKAKVRKKMGSY